MVELNLSVPKRVCFGYPHCLVYQSNLAINKWCVGVSLCVLFYGCTED